MMRFTTLILSLLCLAGHLSFGQTSGDAIFNLLTGGPASTEGKSWKVVPDRYKTGLGPLKGPYGDWFNFPEGLGQVFDSAFSKGMLENTFTFRKDSMYIPENNRVTLHWAHANKFFGASRAQYQDTHYVDPKHVPASFLFRSTRQWPNSTGYEFEITKGSYLGYYENRYVYQIIAIKTDTMFLCQGFSEDPTTDPALDSTSRCFTFVHVPTVITDLYSEAMQGLIMSVFPNPASSSVSFSPNVTSFRLYNVAGKAILSGEGTSLDIAKLERGLYPIQLIDSKGKTVYQKLLKE